MILKAYKRPYSWLSYKCFNGSRLWLPVQEIEFWLGKVVGIGTSAAVTLDQDLAIGDQLSEISLERPLRKAEAVGGGGVARVRSVLPGVVEEDLIG